MRLINFVRKDNQVIDLFIKTNRYYDSKLEDSILKFNLKSIKKLEKNFYHGKADEKLYNFYCQKVIDDELKLKDFLNLDIYKFNDFKKYIEKLADYCTLTEGYYLKDDFVIKWFYTNQPYKTIKNCRCSDIDELLIKYTCQEIMALTRIFESKNWHSQLFDFIEIQPISAFEKRKIKIIIFDSEDFECISNFNKITWDDKICGSIFSIFMPHYISKVPYLRTATEFFHFIFEFSIYNSFAINVLKEESLARFKIYFQNEIKIIDIFEPHALSEGLAWKNAITKLFEVFTFLNNCWYKENLKLYYNQNYILSNNIIDYIRALSSAKFPNIATVSSLLVRLEILMFFYKEESIKKSIEKSLDKEIINIYDLIKK